MPDLRTGSRADLLEVAAWIRSARECRLWSGGCVAYPIDPAQLEEAIGFERVQSWFLADSAAVLGFGQIIPKAGFRAHLARIIVHPQERGRGLGTMLMTRLLQQTLETRPACVSLNVDGANTAALSLYRKLGFITALRPADEPDSDALYLSREEAPAGS